MVDAKLRRQFMFDAIPTNEKVSLKNAESPFDVVSSFIDIDDLVGTYRRDSLRDKRSDNVISEVDDTHHRVDPSILRQFEYGMRYTKYPDQSELNFSDIRPGGDWDYPTNMNKQIHDDIKNGRYNDGRVKVDNNGPVLAEGLGALVSHVPLYSIRPKYSILVCNLCNLKSMNKAPINPYQIVVLRSLVIRSLNVARLTLIVMLYIYVTHYIWAKLTINNDLNTVLSSI